MTTATLCDSITSPSRLKGSQWKNESSERLKRARAVDEGEELLGRKRMRMHRDSSSAANSSTHTCRVDAMAAEGES